MADLDALAPNYHRAQKRWPNAPTLAESYSALDACFSGGKHGLVEHVKSFIESVCLTIMGELREPRPNSTPSTSDLFTAALRSLGLQNRKGASKLDKVLSGFNRLADALRDMRNDHGPVAHGKDGFLDSVSADHARAFLHTGDAILGVLLAALEGKQPDLIVTREPYESFPHLNDRIDRAASVQVRVDEDGDRPVTVFSVTTRSHDETIELRVEPSRLLYEVDREAYVEVLEATELVVAEVEEEAGEVEGEVAVPEPEVVLADEAVAVAGPGTALVPTYSGKLDTIRAGLEALLTAAEVNPADTSTGATGAEQLVDSLLATAEQNMGLDWKSREQIRARLKVACKRVLIRFGTTPQNADEIAKRMVVWLSEHTPNVATVSSGSPPAMGGSDP